MGQLPRQHNSRQRPVHLTWVLLPAPPRPAPAPLQVLVGEPSVSDTVQILRGLKERYASHHGVQVRMRAAERAKRAWSAAMAAGCRWAAACRAAVPPLAVGCTGCTSGAPLRLGTQPQPQPCPGSALSCASPGPAPLLLRPPPPPAADFGPRAGGCRGAGRPVHHQPLPA